MSDNEKAGVEQSGYTFVPSYLNEELKAGNYVMNGDGNAYAKLSNTPAIVTITNATYENAEAFAAAGTLYKDEGCTEEATSEYYSEHTGDTYYKRTVIPSANETNKVTPMLSAFRPYFTKTTTGGAPRRIIFSGADDKLQQDLEERHSGDADGGLIISVDKRDIVVESTRRDNATVRIVTASGITITTFTIEPGQAIRTTVNMTGVYMVNRSKVVVK